MPPWCSTATALIADKAGGLARSADEFANGTLPGARNVPVAEVAEIINRIASGQRQNAPFPVEDFNSHIVLFGRDAAQARALADVLATRPWHNVSYFPGAFETLRAAIGDK